MKSKILIGILVIGIILAGYFILRETKKREEGMPILDAIPVLYSNLTVNSEEEALAIFKQNFNKIIENTKQELIKYGKSQEARVIKEMVFFSNRVTIEKREWKNDQYWLGPGKSAYVLIAPAVSENERWEEKEGKILVERIKCKGLRSAESLAIPIEITNYEDIKKYLNENCPEGVEIYQTETDLWIKYLIDDNGVIYWAGGYLKIKPWLGY